MTWVLEQWWGLLAFLTSAETALQGSRALPPHSLALLLTQLVTGLGQATWPPECTGQQIPRAISQD